MTGNKMEGKMINKIRDWLLSKLFLDGFKEIEKTNFATKALYLCKKQVPMTIWSQFCDSVIGLLEDAIDEVKQAKKWEHPL